MAYRPLESVRAASRRYDEASLGRRTLYSSTEFKKIRLLYFTDEFRAWEREQIESLGSGPIDFADMMQKQGAVLEQAPALVHR